MIYRFAGYAFDADRGLEGPDGRIPLRRTDSALLRVLLEANGRTVDKDHIVATAWEGRPVTDDSISQAVLRLRRLLPCGRGRQIVQRVHGEGLRIGVAVQVEDDDPAQADGPVQPGRAAAMAHLNSARELSVRRNPADSEASVRAAVRATALYPDDAGLWGGLAEIYAYRLSLELDVPADLGRAAVAAAEEGLNRDAACASALAVRGWVRAVLQGEIEAGLDDLRKCNSLHRHYWVSRMVYGWALVSAGRTADAVAEIRLVNELNPWGVWNAGMLALYLMFDGRLEDALIEGRAAIRQFPHLDTANLRHSVIASACGMHDEAIASGRVAAERSPDLPLMQTALASALAWAGRRDESVSVMRRIEATGLPLPAALLANAWIALGDRERAIRMLQMARKTQSPYLPYAFVDPRLAELRGDPAFERLRHAPGRSTSPSGSPKSS